MRKASAVLVAALFVFAASEVSADAINGPPACPPGAHGASSHSGQRCLAAPCETDAQCNEGERCVPWRVCTRPASVHAGGRGAFGPTPPPPHAEQQVIGSCAPGAGCNGTESAPPRTVGLDLSATPTCVEQTFCVPAALPSLPPPEERGASPAAPTAPEAPTPTPAVAAASAPPAARAGGCGCTSVAHASTVPLFALLGLALVVQRRSR